MMTCGRIVFWWEYVFHFTTLTWSLLSIVLVLPLSLWWIVQHGLLKAERLIFHSSFKSKLINIKYKNDMKNHTSINKEASMLYAKLLSHVIPNIVPISSPNLKISSKGHVTSYFNQSECWKFPNIKHVEFLWDFTQNCSYLKRKVVSSSSIKRTLFLSISWFLSFRSSLFYFSNLLDFFILNFIWDIYQLLPEIPYHEKLKGLL